MKDKNDWRLQGQEKYLKGATLVFEKYHTTEASWDHDHCEFCSKKFSETLTSDTEDEGYTTRDHYRWICKKCFDDFHELFHWKVELPTKDKS